MEQSISQADKLRRGVLKKAFEGKLVPQAPADEPAEKLLGRIKTEKANRETERKETGKGRNKVDVMQRRLI